MGNENGMDVVFFAIGFLAGGLAGAVTALLLALQSGEETRAQIRRKGEEIRGKAKETMNDARARVEAVAAGLLRRTEELQVQGQTALEGEQEQLAKALEETKKAVEATVETPDEEKTEVVKGRKKTPTGLDHRFGPDESCW